VMMMMMNAMIFNYIQNVVDGCAMCWVQRY
jgi:disulfide bond formation protein DsbB